MTEDEAVDKLREAMGYRKTSAAGRQHARRTMTNLIIAGLTIYHKKVFRNPRRLVSSARMTPELRAAILQTFNDNPAMTQNQIAAQFNINNARVNEG